jgi:hypothetical protein
MIICEQCYFCQHIISAGKLLFEFRGKMGLGEKNKDSDFAYMCPTSVLVGMMALLDGM